MDRWAWDQLDPWLEVRRELPIGAMLCVVHGPTAGRRWEASAARKQLHHAAAAAGVRRRVAPHQLRHAHAVEMADEGVPLVVIQRQLGHAHLGITSYHAGHRQQRDHRHGPRTAISDGLRQRRSPDEAIDRSTTGLGFPASAGPTQRPHPRLANKRRAADERRSVTHDARTAGKPAGEVVIIVFASSRSAWCTNWVRRCGRVVHRRQPGTQAAARLRRRSLRVAADVDLARGGLLRSTVEWAGTLVSLGCSVRSALAALGASLLVFACSMAVVGGAARDAARERDNEDDHLPV